MSICVYDNPRSRQREIWINGKIRTSDDAELWYRYGTDPINGPWSGNAWRPGQLQGLRPAGCALAALLDWHLP